MPYVGLIPSCWIRVLDSTLINQEFAMCKHEPNPLGSQFESKLPRPKQILSSLFFQLIDVKYHCWSGTVSKSLRGSIDNERVEDKKWKRWANHQGIKEGHRLLDTYVQTHTCQFETRPCSDQVMVSIIRSLFLQFFIFEEYSYGLNRDRWRTHKIRFTYSLSKLSSIYSINKPH